MQTKLPDGSIMVAGACGRDPEFKLVGENDHRKCTVGLAVGKKPDPEGGERPITVWCNLVAWHDLASILAAARKGDSVLAIGKLKSREYNGKTYTDLEAEYISVASVRTAAAVPSPQASELPADDQFTALNEDDGELPF